MILKILPKNEANPLILLEIHIKPLMHSLLSLSY